MYRCVLFDLDGTLIDTIPLILDSYRHTFAVSQLQVPSDEELIPLIGIPLEAAFEQLAPGRGTALSVVYREHNHIHHDGGIGIFLGIPKFLQTLRDQKILTGVVTSKRTMLTHRGLKVFDLAALFDVIITADDSVKHKPDGEPIRVACARLGIPADQSVLYVGDSIFDIRAAHHAGVHSAAVMWSRMPEDVLLAEHPTQTWSDTADALKQVLNGEPS